ncbi:MAG TPA: flagellar motor switch protein FliM, partial [Chromatiaceae bacterium]|nr:flagellar motor switch protein FliM [Chromatiaceae bacterium]
FDFEEQEHLSRNQYPQLDLISQRFARHFSSSLYHNMLKRPAEVETDAVQLFKYGEYIDSLEAPSSMNLIHVHPLNGTALVVMDPVLVFLAVDNYFGGEGRINITRDKVEFTPTERRIIQLLINLAFDDLKRAWQPLVELEFEYVKSEVNPRFTSIVTPAELVAVSRMKINLDGGSGEFHLVLPLVMLEPIREQLESGPLDTGLVDDALWLAGLRREIFKAKVELKSVLFEIPMTLRDVLRLQPGDVLPVELREHVVLQAAGVPVLQGNFGVVKGRNAVKIDEPLATTENNH